MSPIEKSHPLDRLPGARAGWIGLRYRWGA